MHIFSKRRCTAPSASRAISLINLEQDVCVLLCATLLALTVLLVHLQTPCVNLHRILLRFQVLQRVALERLLRSSSCCKCNSKRTSAETVICKTLKNESMIILRLICQCSTPTLRLREWRHLRGTDSGALFVLMDVVVVSTYTKTKIWMTIPYEDSISILQSASPVNNWRSLTLLCRVRHSMSPEYINLCSILTPDDVFCV